jgi:hypothetical protein
MISLLRRFLVLAALMFWQGGFVFYAAVVVPIGTEVLNGATEQGFITRHVTRKINWTGTIALVPFVWDAFTADSSRWRQRARLALVGLMAICLIVLFRLHPQMDAMMFEQNGVKSVDEYDTFHRLHRIYLWTITAQFAGSVVFALASLAAWRDQDRNRSESGSIHP